MATKAEIIAKLSQCGGLSYQDWIVLLDSIYFDGDVGDIYEPVETTALPKPEGDFKHFSIVGQGVYTYPTGGFEIPENMLGVISYDPDTDKWSISSVIPLPIQQGVPVLNPEGSDIPTEKAVADYAISKKSLRIFPENYEVSEIDRPDLNLPDIIFVDLNGIIITENWDLDYSMLQNYSLEDIDRPDLGNIVEVDKNYRILSQNTNNNSSAQKVVDSLFSKKFYEPDVQPEFNQTDLDLIKYDQIIAKWDAILTKANVGFEYVTRQEIGRSSTKDLPIYRYDFKPENPTAKILLTTGLHGSEKVYIKLLSSMFDNLVSKWFTDPLLEWLRFNVHFIIIPVVSPSCTEGRTEGSGGGRRVHETDPIDVTFTKNGTLATVTFDTANFPNTNGRLNASTYFSNGNIAGKTWVSIFNSSLSASLPNKGYVIQSVVNGNTIIVETGSSDPTSGTARLYVGVDINRNMQLEGTSVWDNFTPTASSSTIYSNDWVANPNDNKGTKPFSLAESIAFKNIIDNNPDLIFYLDLHSGAGSNYLHWNTKTFDGQSTAIEEIKQDQSAFNNDGFSRVVIDLPNIPYSATYVVGKIDKAGFTIEWEQVATTTSKSATDAMRWLNTSIISLVRNLK